MGFHDDGPAKLHRNRQLQRAKCEKRTVCFEVWGPREPRRSLPRRRRSSIEPYSFVLTVAHITGHFRHGDRYGEIRISLHEVQKAKTTEPAIFMDVIQEKFLNMGFVAPV